MNQQPKTNKIKLMTSHFGKTNKHIQLWCLMIVTNQLGTNIVVDMFVGNTEVILGMPIITDNIILLFGMPRSKLTCLHGQPLIDSLDISWRAYKYATSFISLTNLIGCLIIYEGMFASRTSGH